MGFYITTEESNILIPTKNLDAAYQSLVDLNTNPEHAHLKGSGSPSQRTFAWMPANFHEQATTAQEVFELMGYETELNTHGLVLTNYDGMSGDERHFFAAIARYVDPGSYIHFRGEDRSHWRFDFDGESAIELDGQIVFS